MRIRKGVKLLDEVVGTGAPIERKQYYVLAIRITLNRGDIVRHPEKFLGYQVDGYYMIGDDGYFLHSVRVHRENFIGGIFYAILGMHVGGYRKVEIGPHLAYGETGVPGIIPPEAKLTVEIKVLDKLRP